VGVLALYAAVSWKIALFLTQRRFKK
jgi:hypothetical protein